MKLNFKNIVSIIPAVISAACSPPQYNTISDVYDKVESMKNFRSATSPSLLFDDIIKSFHPTISEKIEEVYSDKGLTQPLNNSFNMLASGEITNLKYIKIKPDSIHSSNITNGISVLKFKDKTNSENCITSITATEIKNGVISALYAIAGCNCGTSYHDTKTVTLIVSSPDKDTLQLTAGNNEMNITKIGE